MLSVLPKFEVSFDLPTFGRLSDKHFHGGLTAKWVTFDGMERKSLSLQKERYGLRAEYKFKTCAEMAPEGKRNVDDSENDILL